MKPDTTILQRVEEHDKVLEDAHALHLLYEKRKAELSSGLITTYDVYTIKVTMAFLAFLSSSLVASGANEVVLICQDIDGKPFRMVVNKALLKKYYDVWNQSTLNLFTIYSELKALKSKIPTIIGEM